MCVCMFVCVRASVCIYMRVCIYGTYACACVHGCMYVCMHACMYALSDTFLGSKLNLLLNKVYLATKYIIIMV